MLIVRKTNDIFDFCESSNGTIYDGMVYGGSSVKLSYTNKSLTVIVDGGERKSYDTTELNYDNGTYIIGFATMSEFITAIKSAGFTGNFNSGGATPQVNYSNIETNTGQKFFGSDIYAKVYQGEFIEGNIDIDISGNAIDKYLGHELFYLSVDGLYSKSFVNPSINSYSKIDARKGNDGDYVSIYNVAEDLTTSSYLEVGQPFYLTIFYTKI